MLTLLSSLVAFGPRSRMIGETAKTQETSNFRNTVGSLKRLIGRTMEYVHRVKPCVANGGQGPGH